MPFIGHLARFMVMQADIIARRRAVEPVTVDPAADADLLEQNEELKLIDGQDLPIPQRRGRLILAPPNPRGIIVGPADASTMRVSVGMLNPETKWEVDARRRLLNRAAIKTLPDAPTHKSTKAINRERHRRIHEARVREAYPSLTELRERATSNAAVA